jgi:hypothetical protein
MRDAEDSNPLKSDECPTCFDRREKLQAIGLSVFFVSLFSCGLLLPVSVVTAIVIQSLSLRKCRICRARIKQERRAASEAKRRSTAG